MNAHWDQLTQAIGVEFRSHHLLQQAFTHASYRNEHRRPGLQDNERLEFLGDAVLELIVSDYLYQTRPDLPEGELTRLRAAIVCEPALVKFARDLKFDQYIRLGKGEERSGGRNRAALMADVFEAFIGALYLDQGIDTVRAFMEKFILPKLEGYSLSFDYKTALQEWVQQHEAGGLRYVTLEERGPAHAKEFVMRVLVADRPYGEGIGHSKKEAEQQAAKTALQVLQQRGIAEGR
ncbi:ribonuclease III [Alicyclobacillaceae bacterium I2511]|nr:ribonuclease III [Alicyclobacillaceae bacterium I2511]